MDTFILCFDCYWSLFRCSKGNEKYE